VTRWRSRAPSIVIVAVLAATSARAQVVPPAEIEAEPSAAGQEAAGQELREGDAAVGAVPLEPDAPWTPPAPNPKAFDWIRLESGEWLKGRIQSMRDESLEFDSKELDELSIDFDDIAEIHSPRQNTFVFEDKIVASGTAVMKGDDLVIDVKGTPTTFDRKKLLVIIEGLPRERNYWNGGLSLGASWRAGNTNSFDFNSSAWVRRRDEFTRIRLDYLGAVGSVDDEVNTSNRRATLKFDWFLTRRFYLTPLWFDYYNDRFQNIEYRIIPAAGLGYEVLKRGSLSWNIVGAIGYQRTKFRTVEVGAKDVNQTGALILGTTFETDITKYVDFDFSYNVNIGVPDIDETNHHAEAVLSVDLYGPLDLDLSVIFDRNESPEPIGGDDSTTPKKNDLRTVVGLGVDF